MDNIHVVIRVRPLFDEEETVHWHVNSNAVLQVDCSKTPMCQPYIFDQILDSNATSEEVFAEIGIPTLDAVMEGYNGTVFAYGQTSSGKTHTMMGTESDKGLIPRIAMALFEAIENTPLRRFLIRLSYMEIYNEKVFDLISDSRKPLNVREDMNGQTFVENLTEDFVRNCEDVLGIMRKGESNRSYSATNANVNSSRSHTIFRMIIESELLKQDLSVSSDVAQNSLSNSVIMVSHLNLVDLAGSERTGQSGTSGDRFRESCAINTSLLSLRNVIGKLSQADGSFINYRDSNLTRILKSSLGGNAKTSIICTVTPAMIEETHSTLKFASTAKTIKNKPKINEVLSDEAHLNRCKKEIKTLHRELELCKQNDKEKELKLQETSQKNQELEARLKILNERIITSSLNEQPDIAPRNRRETWAFGSILKRQGSTKHSDPETIHPSKFVKFDLGSVSEQRSFTDDFFDESVFLSNEETSKPDGNQNEALAMMETQVATLQKEKLQLQQKIIILEIELETEKMQRITAEKNYALDNTYHFLEEENNIQDSEIKFLEEKASNLTKTVNELEALVLESRKAHSVLTSEKAELMCKVTKLEEQLSVVKEQLKIAKIKNEQLVQEQRDYVVKYELQYTQFEILKSELRQELQKAYDYIERLEKLRGHSGNNGKARISIKNIVDKSISEIMPEMPASPEHGIEEDFLCSQPKLNSCNYDAEMQIVQMDFDLREASLREEILQKEALITDLEKRCAEFETKLTNLDAEAEKNNLLLIEKDKKEQQLLELENLSAELLEYNTNQNQLSVKLTNNEMDELQQKLVELEKAMVIKDDHFKCELETLHGELSHYKLLLEKDKHMNQNSSQLAEMEKLIAQYKQKETVFVDEITNLRLDFAQCKEFILQNSMNGSSMIGEPIIVQKNNENIDKLVNIQTSEVSGMELEKSTLELQHLLSTATDDMKIRLEELEKQMLECPVIESQISENTEGLDKQIEEYKGEMKQIADGMKELTENICITVNYIDLNADEVEKCTMHHGCHNEQHFASETKDMQHAKATDNMSENNVSAAEINDQKNEYLLDDCLIDFGEPQKLKPNNKDMSDICYEESLHETNMHFSGMLEDNCNLNKIVDLEALLAQKEHLTMEIEEVKQELNHYKIMSLEMEKQANLNAEKLTEMQRKEEEMECLVSDYRKNESDLKEEISKLQLQLMQCNALISERDSMLSNATDDLVSIEKQNELLEKCMQENIETYKIHLDEMEKLKADIDRHRKKNESLEECIHVHTQTNKIQLEELEILKAEIGQHEKQTAFLKECIHEQMQTNKIQMEETEHLKANIKQQCEQRNKESELQGEITEYQQREKQLRQYVETLESEIQQKNDLQFNLGELLKDLDSYKQREQVYRNTIKEKTDEMKHVYQLHEETKEKYMSTEEQLKQETHTLKQSEQFLQNYLLELQEHEAKTEQKLEQERQYVQMLKNCLDNNDKLHARELEKMQTNVLDLQQELHVVKKHSQEMAQNVTLRRVPKTKFSVESELDTVHTQSQIRSTSTMLSKYTQCTLLSTKPVQDASCLTVNNMTNTSSMLKFTIGVQCELCVHTITSSTDTRKVCKSIQCRMNTINGEENNGSFTGSLHTLNSQPADEDFSTSSKHEQDVLVLKKEIDTLQEYNTTISRNDGELCKDHCLQQKKIQGLKQQVKHSEDELDITKAEGLSSCNSSVTCVDIKSAGKYKKAPDESGLKLPKGIQSEMSPFTPSLLNPHLTSDILAVSSGNDSDMKLLKEENDLKNSNEILKQRYCELCTDYCLLQNLVKELKQRVKQLESELNVCRTITVDKICDDAYKNTLIDQTTTINDLEKIKDELKMCKVINERLKEELALKVEELYHPCEKRSSFEKEAQYYKDKCEQLKTEIRRLNNSTISSEFLSKGTSTSTTDSGCDIKYTEQCSSGSGAVTRYTVDSLKVKNIQLEKENRKLKKYNSKLQQQTAYYNHKLKKINQTMETVSATENKPLPDKLIMPIIPPKSVYHALRTPNTESPLKEMKLPLAEKSSTLGTGNSTRLLRKSEDPLNLDLTYSSLDKNLDCMVS